MKVNPCDTCLVKPCCTDACPPKHEYTENLLHFLSNLGQIVYDRNGKQVKGVGKRTLKAYEEASSLAAQNSEEHKKIMERYVRSVVH